jgi:RNA-binding protein 8A
VFSEYGAVKNLHFNLDKRTGYAKGYAFIEYEKKEDAKTALEKMNGKEINSKEIKLDFAFKSDSSSKNSKQRSRRHD